MTESFLRLTRKWTEGAAAAALRALTQSVTKSTGQCADELISVSLSERRLIHCGYSDGKPGVRVEKHITANTTQRAKNRLLTSSTGIMGMSSTLKGLKTRKPFSVGLNRPCNFQTGKERIFINSFPRCWMLVSPL